MGLLLGVGDLEASATQFDEATRLADEAGSASLAVYAAVGRGYPLFFAGDLSRLEVLFFDTLPLSAQPGVPEPSRRLLHIWPESWGDRANNSLKVTLSRLRRIGNGMDDDHDGLADCQDPECCTSPGCVDDPICIAPTIEVCCSTSGGTPFDDDGDGEADCADPDCSGDPDCPPP